MTEMRIRPVARRPRRSLVLLLAAAALMAGGFALNGTRHASAAPPVASSAAPPPPSPSDISRGRDLAADLSVAFEHASDLVSPSVVAIYSEQTPSTQQMGGQGGPGGPGGPNDPFRQFFGDDFFRRFFGTPPGGGGRGDVIRGLGSGVLVSPEGYILTNNHVVEGADKLTVVFDKNRRVTAKVVGTDPPTDVAVIKVDAKEVAGLPVAALGDSDRLRVGQWVIAVGNPFQLLRTVTAGIVSARGRSAVGLADYEDFIQTDASINPGNSGGALADLDGRVVGINTAISTPSGGNVGIGFAIPVNMARRVMEELIASGGVSRGYLALVPQDIDENLAAALDLKGTEGALVADVTADGPAYSAGIKRGDIITRFDGSPIHDSQELRNRVAQAKPGSRVEVTVLRSGEDRTLEVKLGERPASAGEAEGSEGGGSERGGALEKLGLGIRALTPDIARQLGLDDTSGALVAEVAPGSPADDAGLRPGDVIVGVGRSPVTSPRELADALSRLASGDSLALLVRRDGVTIYLGLRMP